ACYDDTMRSRRGLFEVRMILSEKSATPAFAGAGFFGIMRGGMTAAELLRQLLDLAAGAFGIDAGFSGAVQLQRDVREVNHTLPFARIRHQKSLSSPLALKNQVDGLGLRIKNHHQRGARCWHKGCSISSMRPIRRAMD
ncbi:MAG TPA: hypothetical protein VGY99_05185, partial [Candidatus Binataceae bacterium]|nr:hypothetical protein [Candidatus Binataceae bacterium]